MTKQFLEIYFPQTPADRKDSTPPELIRLAVADEAEAQSIYAQLDHRIKERPHTAHIHTCNHSAAGNAPCIISDLPEPKK